MAAHIFSPVFFLEPVQALMALEKHSLFHTGPDELHPLRRQASEPLPLHWDTRSLEKSLGEKTHSTQKSPKAIFVARKGKTFDPHIQVEELLTRGCVFVGERARVLQLGYELKRTERWVHEILHHPWFFGVDDTRLALEALVDASVHISPRDFTTIAITGTNGKTSATQIAGQILDALHPTPSLRIGTLGLQFGPQEVWGQAFPTMPDYPGFVGALKKAQDQGMKHVVMEATSIGLYEKRMGDWKVDAAIFTNLTPDHLDFHGDMESYCKAKTLLFSQHLKPRSVVVVNVADPAWIHMARSVPAGEIDIIGYGSEHLKADFFEAMSRTPQHCRYLGLSRLVSHSGGIEGVWRWHDTPTRTPFSYAYACPLVGGFQHENLASVVAALMGLGWPLGQISNIAPRLKGIPGRLEVVGTPVGASAKAQLPHVVVDYAHTPDALEKTLQTCQELLPVGNKLWVVFGCGGDRDPTKRAPMGGISAKLADCVCITSDNPRTENPDDILNEIELGFPSGYKAFLKTPDRRMAIGQIIMAAQSGDMVVIAGKGHEDYQIIGTKTIPFSDVEVAQFFLTEKAQKADA